MTVRLGWGVIGAGRRAREVMIPALAASPLCRVVGACGRDAQSAAKALSPWPEIEVFRDAGSLLKSPEIQVVYIATPHFLHVPQAVESLEAGKHVFMEPPMALSVDGAHKLIEKARARDLKLGVAFPYRFHSAIQAAKVAAGGELGEIIHLSVGLEEKVRWETGWWLDAFRSGPAALFRLGLPALDLAAWLKGQAVNEVFALGHDQADPPVNVQVSILLRFSDLSLGYVLGAANFHERKHFIRLEGTRGRLELAGDFSGQGSVTLREAKDAEDRTVRFEPEDPVGQMIDAFVATIQSGAAFPAEGTQAQKTVELSCAVIESMKSRRLTRVGEVLRVTAGPAPEK